jgi:adenylate cyclase
MPTNTKKIALEDLEKQLKKAQKKNRSLQSRIHVITEISDEQNEQMHQLTERMARFLPKRQVEWLEGNTEETHHAMRKQEVAIFFSDLVGFTKLADHLEPEVLTLILNTYLEDMADIAMKWDGVIDKFIGDAIMIFFDHTNLSSSEKAFACVGMAMEMKLSLKNLNAKLLQQTGLKNLIKIRVGINLGISTLGSFGSEFRKDYTVIGGQINLAARLESRAETNSIYIPCKIKKLISHKYQCTFIGREHFKGISEEVSIYRVDKELVTPYVGNSGLMKQGIDTIQFSITANKQRLSHDKMYSERLKKSLYDMINFIEENSE